MEPRWPCPAAAVVVVLVVVGLLAANTTACSTTDSKDIQERVKEVLDGGRELLKNLTLDKLMADNMNPERGLQVPQFRRLIEQEEREMAYLELRYELRREIIRLLFAYEQRNIPFALNSSDDYPLSIRHSLMVGVDDAVLKQLEGKMQCLAEGVSGTYYCFVIEELPWAKASATCRALRMELVALDKRPVTMAVQELHRALKSMLELPLPALFSAVTVDKPGFDNYGQQIKLKYAVFGKLPGKLPLAWWTSAAPDRKDKLGQYSWVWKTGGAALPWENKTQLIDSWLDQSTFNTTLLTASSNDALVFEIESVDPNAFYPKFRFHNAPTGDKYAFICSRKLPQF